MTTDGTRVMKTILARVRDAGIFAEEMGDPKPAPVSRYKTDAVFREHKLAYQKTWNALNRERKRANDIRWAKEHGAEIARRFRKRQKDLKNGCP